MTQSHSNGQKRSQTTARRSSSTTTDDTSHSANNIPSWTLQTLLDDVPFQFNPKYLPVIVPNIDIPEYDTTKIRQLLARPIDLTLENKVLVDALEDLQRRKKVIEADALRRRSPGPPTTNCQSSDSASMPTGVVNENVSHSAVHPAPPLTLPSVSHPSVSLNLPPSVHHPSATPLPPIPPNFRLPSVRDIYWPSGTHQQYAAVAAATVPRTFTDTSNRLPLPAPINSTRSSPHQPLPNTITHNNWSFNSCDSTAASDLAATFDGTVSSSGADPFNDAELKSLNDVAELRHLYAATGSANTVRR